MSETEREEISSWVGYKNKKGRAILKERLRLKKLLIGEFWMSALRLDTIEQAQRRAKKRKFQYKEMK